MRLAPCLTPLLLSAVVAAPSASAGDALLPDGFNLETRPTGGQPVFTMNDGSTLVKFGGFGPNAFRVLHADGTLSLYATGVGSFAGAAQSPVTGDVFIGDFNTGGVWHFHDDNDDGDALDVGEQSVLAASLALLPGGLTIGSYSLAFEPGTDDLYFNGGAADFSATYVVRVTDASTPTAAANIYFQGLTFSGGVAWHDGALYTGDFAFPTSRVVKLVDGNDDGDALDAGESHDYVSGLPGVNLLAFDAAGRLYISGVSDFVTVNAIARCAPDADADDVADAVDTTWLDGVGFTGSLLILEGPGGLEGGASGDGVLWFEADGLGAGSKLLRTAPFASTGVVGDVADDSHFDVVVGGAPGALAVVVLSLDTAGVTITGFGDTGVGFSAAHLVSAPLPVNGSGEAVLGVTFHGLDALVGLDLAIQGFVLEGGEVGFGDGLTFVVGG